MKDYNTDLCNSCGASTEDLTIDGEDVKLTYHLGQLFCQDCIFDIETQSKFLEPSDEHE